MVFHLPFMKRKSIFNAKYQFSRMIKVKYKTIIIDKKYTNNVRILRQKLSIEINNMVKEHENYFKKYDKSLCIMTMDKKFLEQY